MPSKKATIYHTASSEETKTLGEEFSAEAFHAARHGTGALIVVLTGDLGAGKTTFIQGFLRGAGIRRRAPSPTFIIMRRYATPRARRAHRAAPLYAHIYHMDAYRLKDESQLEALEFRALADDPRNIILIEWGERIAKALPRDAVRIAFAYGKKEGSRKISIRRPGSYR
jgi:tRNA threonylcarbamoyladenosine biosynthesis protein TsaE